MHIGHSDSDRGSNYYKYTHEYTQVLPITDVILLILGNVVE